MRTEFFAYPLGLVLTVGFATTAASAQQTPVPIVQPGAPGQPSKTLTPDKAVTSTARRPPSDADVQFMQGMIMHHNQAVEMTELLKSHGSDKEVLALGQRIDVSQTDEMRYMKQWLTDRDIPLEAPMPGMSMDHSKMTADQMAHMDMSSMAMPAMPGMLTPQQMDTLRASNGTAFDHLFLTGMIQHHTGALTMVKQLFAQPGAGQDPQLFDFASDVDNTQQAEIDIMRHMLKENK